ncbi:polysaccharide biosynthesis protein [Confluentibacter sediminis]|uniref:polysaccharide biosynthesis protein n=1 Tax=Confluentibacter sediminis TaxID=2219045 RepID=UPI000DAB6F2A|nr:polysaccharide biosynthesis protein [Confluentibacter sediminis]
MIKKYFTNHSKKHASKWMVFAIDIAIVLLAFSISYIIRFNFRLNFDLNQFLIQIPFVLACTAVSFLFFKSFRSVIRYTAFSDIVNLFKSVVFMTTLTALSVFINNEVNLINGFTIPLSILVIHSLLSFVLLSTSRLLFKMYFNYFNNKYISSKRVLIYGTDDSAVITYNALINSTVQRFNVLGFIDDNVLNKGKSINGISILPLNKINKEFIKSFDIDEIIISIEDIDENRCLILKALNIKLTKVPSLESWVSGDFTFNKTKKIQIEDLLGRTQIKINNTNVAKEFVGETLLITGATGSIGKELVRELINFDVKKLILIDHSESALYDLQLDLKLKGKHNFVAVVADISDSLRIDMLFQEYKPTFVFHTAEYKHEQLMEKSPYEAIKINVNGTKFLADASSRYHVKKFVFVSSDKAINPTSSIGVTKRLAELYITCLQKESKTKFVITRFGNVMGSKNSLISVFESQIENRNPITIAHKEMTRFFMTIFEAVELVLEAATMGKGGEIFVFDTGESIKIYNIAKKMINLAGLNYPEDIDIKETGLALGEKIHEEFTSTIESPAYTYHKKILIFTSLELNHAKIKSEIEELCFANRFQHNDIMLKMKQLIPENQPDNSEYDRLYKRVQSYKKVKGMLPEKNNQVNIN